MIYDVYRLLDHTYDDEDTAEHIPADTRPPYVINFNEKIKAAYASIGLDFPSFEAYTEYARRREPLVQIKFVRFEGEEHYFNDGERYVEHQVAIMILCFINQGEKELFILKYS